MPAGVGEDSEDQKRGAKEIRAAIRASKSDDDRDEEEGAWGPATRISTSRPSLNRLAKPMGGRAFVVDNHVPLSPALLEFSRLWLELIRNGKHGNN